MFDHVTLGVADVGASLAFYRTVLSALDLGEPTQDAEGNVEWEDFGFSPAGAGRAVTTGLHLGFVAPSRAHVDAFHAAGVAAGHADDGAPGERPQYSPDYYGAFLRDPDGNSAEAVHRDRMNELGDVDHLWIRVADHDASAAFYTQLAGFAGFEAALVVPGERTRFRGGPGRGSFSVVADGRPVTEHVHVAFPAPEAVVRDWHAAAVAAGHRDNGGPGERPVYHPGYYGAFVLDPDGNNVELVDHHRD